MDGIGGKGQNAAIAASHFMSMGTPRKVLPQSTIYCKVMCVRCVAK